MGGFFGVVSKNDSIMDVYFGVDYHTHLGSYCGGLASFDETLGMQRSIHHIEDAPFRTKFLKESVEMKGKAAIGAMSDTFPQPLIVRSRLGCYAIATVGKINNTEELIKEIIENTNCHFGGMNGGKINGTDLVAALINTKNNFVDGIKYAQDKIIGSANILIVTDKGTLIASRDKLGRIPVQIGKREDGFAVSFESFAFQKLGFEFYYELGPSEIVELSAEKMTVLSERTKKMKICSFLWTYYGYPTSTYEGVNVEMMRYKNGEIISQTDKAQGIAQDIDYVGGVPDSGTPHAIGYSNDSGKRFARAFIKYTPTWSRSFTPPSQVTRSRVAKMKQIPVHDLIKGKKLLFVDDSIVRGTQLKETVEFLYDNGATAVHMRSACPPILFGCKYLNFTRSQSDTELIARRTITELEGEEGLKHLDEYIDGTTERGKNLRNAITEKFKFASLDFQTVDGLIKSIGLPEEDLCTYCMNGKE